MKGHNLNSFCRQPLIRHFLSTICPTFHRQFVNNVSTHCLIIIRQSCYCRLVKFICVFLGCASEALYVRVIAKTWHEWSNVSKSIFFTNFFLFSKTRFFSKSGNKFSTISCLHVEKHLEWCFRVHPWLTLLQNQCLEITLKVFLQILVFFAIARGYVPN